MHFTRREWPVVGLTVLAGLLAVSGTLLAIKWPFTRNGIVKALSQDSERAVTIRGFHQTFFPTPGCVASGVIIHQGPSTTTPPLITVEHLVIKGDYGSLLTFSKRLDEVTADGMHVIIPRGSGQERGSQTGASSKLAVSVRSFVAQHVILEFAPKQQGSEPFVIQIHRTVLSPATAVSPMSFHATLAIPEPPGEIAAEGSFGPWRQGDAFHTPVSGAYTFERANLGEFNGIAGILSSRGRFEGDLAGIDVKGDTDVPDFEVTGASHQLHLATAFHANVNGQTGDVRLLNVDSRFLRTEVIGEGTVASPAPGEDKRVLLNLAVSAGRIQDLLRLVSSGPPGLTGITSLRFKVDLPSGQGRFLERVRLNGDMGVAGGRFTNPKTQQGLEHISQNAAHGEDDPDDVLSDLKGHISVANGIATLTAVTFNVPGASAEMSGTYHLITHRVDLHGTVRLQEKLSETTTGVKSFLLKALDPFFRKKKHLSIVPIRITGVKGNTSIKLD